MEMYERTIVLYRDKIFDIRNAIWGNELKQVDLYSRYKKKHLNFLF